MLLTISASLLFIIKFPSYKSYPNGAEWNLTVPFFILLLMLQRTFFEIDDDSSWAKPPIIVTIISSVILAVSIFSFSNITPIPKSLSCLTYSRQSTVFRANLDIDLVITRSIFCFLHIRIIFRNSGRFLAWVPLIPSSAKIPASVHSFFRFIRSV